MVGKGKRVGAGSTHLKNALAAPAVGNLTTHLDDALVDVVADRLESDRLAAGDRLEALLETLIVPGRLLICSHDDHGNLEISADLPPA